MSGYSIYVTVAEYYPLSNPKGFMGEEEIIAYINDNAVKSVNGQTGDVVVTVPTNTSELNNDSEFITSADIPAVPTNTSELNNDSGFITAGDIPVTSVNDQTGDIIIDVPIPLTIVNIEMTEDGLYNFTSNPVGIGDIFIRLIGSVTNFRIFLPDSNTLIGRKIYLYSSGSVESFIILDAGIGNVYPPIETLWPTSKYSLISDGNNYYQI